MDFLDPGIAQVVASRSGTLWVWTPARGIYVTRVEGELPRGAPQVIETALQKTLAQAGYADSFHDWERMTNYETETRVKLTEISLKAGTAVRSVHFLVGSKVISFGIQIASTVLRNLHTHPSRSSFEFAMRAAVERARR